MKSEIIASTEGRCTETIVEEVYKFKTFMMARFQPKAAGEECIIEEENKFYKGTTGVGAVSKIDWEEEIYIYNPFSKYILAYICYNRLDFQRR